MCKQVGIWKQRTWRLSELHYKIEPQHESRDCSRLMMQLLIHWHQGRSTAVGGRVCMTWCVILCPRVYEFNEFNLRILSSTLSVCLVTGYAFSHLWQPIRPCQLVCLTLHKSMNNRSWSQFAWVYVIKPTVSDIQITPHLKHVDFSDTDKLSTWSGVCLDPTPSLLYKAAFSLEWSGDRVEIDQRNTANYRRHT